jgi:hypothetical protein
MLDRRTAPRSRSWLVRFADGLDAMLSNFVGSADIGPYVAPDPLRRLPDIACPSCDQPISKHQTDRTATIGRLYCPPADRP